MGKTTLAICLTRPCLLGLGQRLNHSDPIAQETGHIVCQILQHLSPLCLLHCFWKPIHRWSEEQIRRSTRTGYHQAGLANLL